MARTKAIEVLLKAKETSKPRTRISRTVELSKDGRRYFSNTDARRLMDITSVEWNSSPEELARTLDMGGSFYHRKKPLPTRKDVQRALRKVEQFADMLDKFPWFIDLPRLDHVPAIDLDRATFNLYSAMADMERHLSELLERVPDAPAKPGRPTEEARAWLILWLAVTYEYYTGRVATYHKDRVDSEPCGPFFVFVQECFELFNLQARPSTVATAIDKVLRKRKPSLRVFLDWVVPSRK